jgi:hypothetical protein
MQAAATYEVGLEYVQHPSTRQKLMKKLLGVRNKVMGGGLPSAEKPDDDSTAE